MTSAVNGLSWLMPPLSLDGGAIGYYHLHYPLLDEAELMPYGWPLPEDIQHSVRARRVEYLAGRYCAGQALLTLGITDGVVGRYPDRSPAWPVGTLGSLSHTYDRAIACVARQGAYLGVGIDIEKTVGEEMLPALYGLVFTRREGELIDASCLPPCQTATLLFSAREAFYKFISPQAGCDVELNDFSIVDIRHGQFSVELHTNVNQHWRQGRVAEGRYYYDDKYVITLIAA